PLRQSELALELEPGLKARGVVVRRGDMADGPVPDERVQSAQSLLERGLLVVEVGVVDVDVVGLKPLERRARLAFDRRGAEAPKLAAPRAYLRREHDLVSVPARSEPVPDDRLGRAVLD